MKKIYCTILSLSLFLPSILSACPACAGGAKRIAPSLTVEIKTAGEPAAGTPIKLIATFTNSSDSETTKIITPQDGSMVGWLSPKYILENENSSFQPILRCGNHTASYNENTIVEILPNSTKSVTIQFPYQYTKAKKYSLILNYEVAPKKYPGKLYNAPSHTAPKWQDWPKGIFVGKISSNVLKISIS